MTCVNRALNFEAYEKCWMHFLPHKKVCKANFRKIFAYPALFCRYQFFLLDPLAAWNWWMSCSPLFSLQTCPVFEVHNCPFNFSLHGSFNVQVCSWWDVSSWYRFRLRLHLFQFFFFYIFKVVITCRWAGSERFPVDLRAPFSFSVLTVVCRAPAASVIFQLETLHHLTQATAVCEVHFHSRNPPTLRPGHCLADVMYCNCGIGFFPICNICLSGMKNTAGVW